MQDNTQTPANGIYRFGPFRLDAAQRLLFRDAERVALSPKAVDLLLVLVASHGQLVEKDELMRLVWPGVVVEESNLALQISQLRKLLIPALGADPIATVPRRGYRFVAPLNEAAVAPDAPQEVVNRDSAKTRYFAGAVVLVVVIVIAGWIAVRSHRHETAASSAAAARDVLTEKDSVLLADIQNQTGESVFDATLRQALSIQLEQSTFLTLVSDQQIQSALAMMSQPRDARLTQNLAWELCQRVGSAAVIYGSIARLANEYVLGLRAVSCRTGETLSNQQVRAPGKDQVLKAVDDAATTLRTQLGESLAQVQRYNAPIEQVTTPSFAALEAYSRGWLMNYRRADPAGAVSFYQRAISLDPDFAMAYAALGQTYSNLYEPDQAAKYLERAYAFRGRVSERERFYIESRYQRVVTGDLEQARLVNQQWLQVYPRDGVPYSSLSLIDRVLGQYPRALDEARSALRLAPDAAQSYSNLSFVYLLLNRLADAKAVAAQAQSRNLDSPLLRLNLFYVAYLEHDQQAASQLEAWSAGQSVEDRFLEDEALQAAHAGLLERSRDLSQRAIAVALHAGNREVAAGYQAYEAVVDGAMGDLPDARRAAGLAMATSQDRDTRFYAGLALALAGDTSHAGQLMAALAKDLPQDTVVQSCYLPTLRAVLALGQGNATEAVRDLEPTKAYELGKATNLYPVYVRGLAQLALRQPKQARVEFRKIVDLPGVSGSDPVGALAALGIARADAQEDSKDTAEAYRGVLAMWQGAAAGVPVVAAARSEAARAH